MPAAVSCPLAGAGLALLEAVVVGATPEAVEGDWFAADGAVAVAVAVACWAFQAAACCVSADFQSATVA